MDRPLQVGDLVIITSWRCCGRFSGAIRTIATFNTGFIPGVPAVCNVCGAVINEPVFVVLDPTLGNYKEAIVTMAWLKRIPPAEELGLTDERLDEAQPA